jgi:transposase
MIFLVEGRTLNGCSEEVAAGVADRAMESDRPLAHIARDLGVHPEALRNWVRQDEADRVERANQLSTA